MNRLHQPRALGRALRWDNGCRTLFMLLTCPNGAESSLNRVAVVARAVLGLLIFSFA